MSRATGYIVLIGQSRPASPVIPTPLSVVGLPLAIALTSVSPLRVGEALLLLGQKEAPFQPQAAYTFDALNRPRQITGTHNLLLDGADIADTTRPGLCRVAWAQALAEAVYARLTLEEMQRWQETLQEWEQALCRALLAAPEGAKACRQEAQSTVSLLPDALSARAQEALEACKLSRRQEGRRLYNWEGYAGVRVYHPQIPKSRA